MSKYHLGRQANQINDSKSFLNNEDSLRKRKYSGLNMFETKYVAKSKSPGRPKTAKTTSSISFRRRKNISSSRFNEKIITKLTVYRIFLHFL